MDIYQLALRPLLFSQDPETISNQALAFLQALDSRPASPVTKLAKASFEQLFCRTDRRLEQSIFGLNFANPVGLAAGFDKNGVAAGMWQYLGFGFAELGTVTYHPRAGNDTPRLFRLDRDRAALNRMGLNNSGASAMATKLEIDCSKSIGIPIGISLGNANEASSLDVAKDYLASFQMLKNLGDYFVLNVSCPNVSNSESSQEISNLQSIFDIIQQDNQAQKPILLKVSPDLDLDRLTRIIELAQDYKIAGIIATNTTKDKSNLSPQRLAATGERVVNAAGGISGKPLQKKSTEIIRFIYQQTGGKLPIIGVGGIFTAEDAWEKITAGASLIQVYTGWIYNGPWMVDRILTGLLAKLEIHGLTSISAAIGRSNL
jgi:dihydroorotate dehydrogenase